MVAVVQNGVSGNTVTKQFSRVLPNDMVAVAENGDYIIKTFGSTWSTT